MLGIAVHIVRFALVAMIFHFIVPAFLTIVVLRIPTFRETTVSAAHATIVAPMLLKEKEETETSESLTSSHPAELLDLASHTVNLTASHNHEQLDSIGKSDFIPPPRLHLFCSLII